MAAYALQKITIKKNIILFPSYNRLNLINHTDKTIITARA